MTPTPEQHARKAADAVKAGIDALTNGEHVSLQQLAELRSNLDQVIEGYHLSRFAKHGEKLPTKEQLP